MANYFDKTSSGNTLFNNLNTLEERVSQVEQSGGGGSSSSGVTQDVPLTLGELYCVRKAMDLIKATAYLTNTLAVPDNNTQVAGDTIVGIPYSSTVVENTFVPNHVSFDTYYTALSDPNSYAYTRIPKPDNARAYLYYGMVCTEFACHCLGIKPIIHINGEIFDLDGMELVTQDAQAAHIGYILNSEGRGNRYHILVVIGVKRLNGAVTHVTLAESTAPYPRATEYTASEFNTMLDTFTMCKYNRLHENTYEPWMSPYKLPYVNKTIMPAKGDKANWSANEDVVINIINKGDFTQYVVVKDGVEASPVNIGSGTSINLGHMAYGKYSIYLTDGTNKSAPVEWIVVDMHMSATAMSGGIVRFSFSSKNAVPIACAWANPSSYFMMPTFAVTKEDIVKGYKDTKPSTEQNIVAGITEYSQQKTQYALWRNFYSGGSNTIRPRMLFETEFGIITTDWNNANDVTYQS